MIAAWNIVIIASTIAALLLLVWILARHRRATTGGIGGQPVGTRHSIMMTVLLYGSGIVALSALLGAIYSFTALFSVGVNVTIPVTPFWPAILPETDVQFSSPAAVTAGGLTTADVWIQDLSMGTRWLVAGTGFTRGLTTAVIAFMITLLCQTVRSGSRLAETAPRRLSQIGLALGLGGTAWQILDGLAGSAAAREVLDYYGYSQRVPVDTWDEWLMSEQNPLAPIGLPTASGGVFIEWWPLAVGGVIAVLGYAIESVLRIERENARLRRETEGLV